MSLPTLTVCGNVQKIETRQTQSGKNVTTLNVSCGEKNIKGDFENLYIKADFWDKQSDFVSKYFKEGSAIIVTGKLVTTNYTKQDGSKIYETKFLFPSASFAPKDKSEVPTDSRPSSGGGQPYQSKDYGTPKQTAAQNQQGAIPAIDVNEDEIPFAPMNWRL